MTHALLLASEAGTAGDGGILAEGAWLIVVVPLAASVLIALIGKRLPYKGYELAIGSLGFVFLYSLVLFVANMGDGIVFEQSIEIARLGPIEVEWGWLVDGLSIMMFFVVGAVGFFVFAYSYGYMRGEVRYTFFFSAFTLFAGSMLVLAAAPNLLQLIVGWELVALCSYLLIGHHWEDHYSSSSAIKAFITNKAADVGLVLGVIILTITVGSFRIADILTASIDGQLSSLVAVTAGVLLFIGAMGKSGQFPLHVWLPDAMAGPTPVSALMHAATMVTAGIYLLARMFPFYEGIASDVQVLVLAVGTVTLFATGLVALVQDDIKRVLAYSTLSQLGYMAAALGAGAYTAAVFHLFTHAFFKALLFLAAGSVIHAVHSNNMSDMGGLRKFMPTTYGTFVVGSLALAGVFPLAGFFSKDEILASMSHEGFIVAMIVALAGALVTALYMARAVFLTFHGKYKGAGQPHESPLSMTAPLVALAVLSAVAGFVNIPGVFTGFTDWVGTRAIAITEFHAESFNVGIGLLGTAVVLFGIWFGYRQFWSDAATQQERDGFAVPVLYPLLERKYYIDDFYFYGIIKPIREPIARFIDWTNGHIFDAVVNGAGYLSTLLSRFVYAGFDQRGIDLTINAAGAITDRGAGILRFTQTGKIQQYAAVLFAGTVLLVVGFIIFG